MSEAIQIGHIYRHYKGSLYRVLKIARHSETLDELVIYQSIDDEKQIWARPLLMFLETVHIDDEEKPRFSLTTWHRSSNCIES